MSQNTLAWSILLLVGAVSLWAQQGGGGGQGGTGGGGGNTPTTTTPSPGGRGEPGGVPGQSRTTDPFGSSRQQQQQQRMPDFQRPVFLSGKVMMEDGTPPPEPVTIERVCNGRPFPEGYTDSKGRFSIQLGGDRTLAMTDASVSGSEASGFGGGAFSNDPFSTSSGSLGGADSMGRVNLVGCELRAVLAGYQSDSVELGRRSVFDNPNVGTITLRRLGNVEGTSISMTTLAAPKDAKKAYEKAFKETQKKKPNLERASKELEKAVEEYPEYAAAWHLLGRVRISLDQNEGAREAFEKAVEADSKYLNPYGPLVRMALQDGRWDDAAQLSNRVLQLDPYQTEFQYYHAVSSYNMGRIEAAEKSVMAVQSSKDAHRFPETMQLLGMIHARQGKFQTAADEFRSFLTAQPNSPMAGQIQQQLTEWEALGVIKAQEAASEAGPR